MKITLKELLVSGQGVDTEALLEDWRWLVGHGMAVVLITAMGDLFLVDTDGRVYWLRACIGEMFFAAGSVKEFQASAQEMENAKKWFMPHVVGQLIEVGMTLGPGKCYSFIKPPSLGGEFEIENIEVSGLAAHFSVMGKVHEKLKGG